MILSVAYITPYFGKKGLFGYRVLGQRGQLGALPTRLDCAKKIWEDFGIPG